MPFADTAKYFTMEKLTFNAIEAMKSAKAVLMNSYDGFDTESLDVMSSHPSMSQTKFLYIGPVAFYNQTTEIPVKKSSIENWLDVQPKSSVLYIAFGTVFNIKDEEVVNLAKALATLNCRYVWALKKHQIEHLPSDILVIDGDDPIPVDQKGFVVTWALQRQILNHSATHSFLSHCGWNSCTEALSSATPIIAWPIAAEQKLNSIVILAKSIGTLIQKTGKASEHVVTENEIIEAITAHSENLDEFSLNMKRYQTLLLESIAEDGNSYNTMKSLYIAE
ncbi:hypothetical protein BC833DRAFT_310224 [Globomyces pollinis-pini]|nr:hypothetical protein BC833DRAFT_310224 [Globomyces pollinis-pini]